MGQIDRTRLQDVEGAANFQALAQDNFEVLAEAIGQVVPTYQSGVPTTIVGPPTAGTWVAKDFWRDAALGEWRCTVGGTPGTWVRVRDAYVTANPVTTVSGYIITRTDLGGARYYWDGAAWQKVNASASDLTDAIEANPWKPTVRVATTGSNITLSGAQTIDGVSVIAGDEVLVKDQTAPEENGIWTCAAGAWTRRADADTTATLKSGTTVYVREGTANAERMFVLTTPGSITVGTTGQTWEQIKAITPTLTLSDMPAVMKEIGLQFVIDGGGATITTGEKGYVEIPTGMTIESVTLLADQTGSIVIDIWKDTYANFPPDVGDSITASAKPTLSSARKSTDSTLTGWTTACAKGDILAFNVDTVSTVTRVLVTIKGTRS